MPRVTSSGFQKLWVEMFEYTDDPKVVIGFLEGLDYYWPGRLAPSPRDCTAVRNRELGLYLDSHRTRDKKGLGGERKILISNQRINKLGPCWPAASVALAPLLGEGRRPNSNKSNLASRYVVNAELLDYIIDQQERPINQYGYETRSAHQYRCSEGFLNWG